MLKDQLISFETATLAKEKGFNERILLEFDTAETGTYFKYGRMNDASFGYQINITQSLLQKWLREEHKISIKIDDFIMDEKITYDFSVVELGSQEDDPRGMYRTYEEALEAGLIYALNKI